MSNSFSGRYQENAFTYREVATRSLGRTAPGWEETGNQTKNTQRKQKQRAELVLVGLTSIYISQYIQTSSSATRCVWSVTFLPSSPPWCEFEVRRRMCSNPNQQRTTQQGEGDMGGGAWYQQLMGPMEQPGWM